MDNRQWKYVIVHLDGEIPTGTDSERVAHEFSLSEDCYVIEMATCKVMTTPVPADGADEVTEYVSIQEQKNYTLEEKGRSAKETYEGTDEDD